MVSRRRCRRSQEKRIENLTCLNGGEKIEKFGRMEKINDVMDGKLVKNFVMDGS